MFISKQQVIYLIGSLRNPEIPRIDEYLRTLGFDVFSAWFAAGPIADDCWKEYEVALGHTYPQALKGYAARHILDFDRTHLDRADMAVLVYPAGRSGHIELGYILGQKKPGYVLLDEKSPPRWDVMMGLAGGGVYETLEDLGEALVWGV